MATRLVLDELDLNLSSFASSLLIIVVIVIAGHRGSRTFGAASVTVASEVIARGGLVKTRRIGDIRHDKFVQVQLSLAMSTQRRQVSIDERGNRGIGCVPLGAIVGSEICRDW